MAGFSRWKAFRYRVEWLLCGAVARGVPMLSRRWCVRLSRLVGWLAWRLDRRGSAVAMANLRCALGGEYNEAQLREIALGSYRNFARTVFDLLWARRLTPENWREYILVDKQSEERLAQLLAGKERGAVSLCSHWGNFEWASLAFGFLGHSVQIVAENFKNPALSEFFNGAREVSGHTIIPQEYSMVRMLKTVKRKGFAGMLVDLTLRPEQAAVPVMAFGRPISATSLHAVLAQRGGAYLIAVHAEPLPDGRCRVEVEPAVSYPEGATTLEIAQRCWDVFEVKIRQRPELWMWPYKHWRYRPREAEPGDYPFYANVSGKFDRMLREQRGQSRSGKTRGGEA